ncbi:MAG: UDP-2,4-diacetamido-2,4,6-trideoxy-beta-L-altropyranose hydrolase [Rhodospirillaceae bacterium]
MKIAVRTDASDQIGSGHIMRCRALAQVLRTRGADVLFVCRSAPGHLIGLLEDDGYTVAALPPRGPAGEEADSAETLAALPADRYDWVIVDHYALGAAWETRLRAKANRVLAIDDIANRPHDCDILLDQNLSVNPAARYAGLTPEGARMCLGPRYALLSESYQSLPARRKVSPEVRRILISFGGADLADMTGLALAALSDPALAGIAVDIVIGRSYPHRERLRAAARSRPGTGILEPRSTLADLLGEADIAIGGGGITSWERCRAGVPSVVVTLADNQVPGTHALSVAGIVRYVGPSDTADAARLRDAICALRDDPAARTRMTELGQMLVDGRGAQRIAELLCPSPDDRVTLRAATADDCGFFYDLVTDPAVRKQSFTHEPILWEGHRAWFDRKLADANTSLWVLDASGLQVGQLRFDRIKGENRAILSYALDSVARGRKWAKKLVALGIKQLLREGPIHITAEVKAENTPSRRVFEQLGFTLTPTPHDDRLVYSLIPQAGAATDQHLHE